MCNKRDIFPVENSVDTSHTILVDSLSQFSLRTDWKANGWKKPFIVILTGFFLVFFFHMWKKEKRNKERKKKIQKFFLNQLLVAFLFSNRNHLWSNWWIFIGNCIRWMKFVEIFVELNWKRRFFVKRKFFKEKKI